MAAKKQKENIRNYTHFITLPLQIVGCWDWYPNPDKEYKIMINNIYLAMVLFTLLSCPIMLIVNLYIEWNGIMHSLEKLGDGLPLVVSVAVVTYFALYKNDLYDLAEFMNKQFKFHSARGLTNMTMEDSYKAARNFALVYTACTLFSVTMYVLMPMIIHLPKTCCFINFRERCIRIMLKDVENTKFDDCLDEVMAVFTKFQCNLDHGVWTKAPLHNWIYMDVSQTPYVLLAFLRMCLSQAFVGLAVGQLGVFFASNAILLCGQLDLLCCSLRNSRYTGLLQTGVQYNALLQQYSSIIDDERHNYIYSKTEMRDSNYHYDKKVNYFFTDSQTQFDIYSPDYEEQTMAALRDCARVCQVVARYKEKFEEFASPLLALRVVQVTLYLCMLLYAASVKFDMITVEYLVAVALDIFVYCYFGNQIILQASRVSTAAYQSAWQTTGVRARRLLLNLLLTNKRPAVMRAGGFLPMDLHTFVVIIKTSFSYYTLLDKINN